MARYTHNGVYTYVRNALKSAYPNLYVTGNDEPIPTQGPAVGITCIDYHAARQYVTFGNDDEQIKVAYDVNVYSNRFNGAPDEAHAIMAVVEQAFRELFFIETTCRPVERSDNRVTRLVARFERHIGLGNDMP